MKYICRIHSNPKFALLNLTAVSAPGKGICTTFYKENFNFVDRIDLLLSFLKPTYRRSGGVYLPNLQYILRILLLVQSLGLSEDEKWTYTGFDPKKYQDPKDDKYRGNLYKPQRQSMAKMHQSVVATWRTREAPIRLSFSSPANPQLEVQINNKTPPRSGQTIGLPRLASTALNSPSPKRPVRSRRGQRS